MMFFTSLMLLFYLCRKKKIKNGIFIDFCHLYNINDKFRCLYKRMG